MSYVLNVGAIQAYPLEAETEKVTYTCHDARQACRPTFVFSISGQVNFRSALHHLNHCHTSSCQHLRQAVIQGFTDKVRWLIEENSYLGCSTIQELLYTSKKTKLTPQVFGELATHLSRCPKEPCAQLRRAVLLKVRSVLGEKITSELI